MRLYRMAVTVTLVTALAGAEERRLPPGERPAVDRHLDQGDIESGRVSVAELIEHGRELFRARFNLLDGQGRPGTTGHGVSRSPTQPAFIRTSGPDANSCAGCHNQPQIGGAGEFAANVFVLAQERDPVTASVAATDSNERGTPSLMGAGAIEMLAREMSAELAVLREAARSEALARGHSVRRPLAAKGVSFGEITVYPDGRIDPRQIEGVDWDLVIRPWHQKGAVASLREFTITALNHHHGIQAQERFGNGMDADGDGATDELTVGDVTALTLFQAALAIPGRAWPREPARRAAAERGEQLFEVIGCAACHLPTLALNHPVFSDPSPLNPPGTLRPLDGRRLARLDLTQEGLGRRLEKLPDGSALVRAFTDLKRHDLNDVEVDHFANEQLAQGALAARAPGAAFTEPPLPRPLGAFLTARLWDVGSTDPYGHRGDLTTLTEAIASHGGEARSAREAFRAAPAEDQAAVIEFLKSLQVLPDEAGGGTISALSSDPACTPPSAHRPPPPP